MDFQNLMQQAEKALAQKNPFVLYKKPQTSAFRKEKLHGIFQKNETLYYLENFQDSGFVFAPFSFPKNQAVFIPENEADRFEAEVPKFSLPQKKKPAIYLDEDLHQQHLNLVSSGIEKIETTDLEKVVLSRKQPVSGKTENSLEVFKNALAHYPKAMVYIFHHPEVGTWLGASPETLLNVERGQLKTMALAGTKPVVENKTPEWTQKEIDEQDFVTRDIQQKTEAYLDNFKVSKTENFRAGSVWHLKTDISGKLNDENQLENIVKNLHPTPAICGTPREMAQNFIAENENYDREFYTGFFGELNLSHKNYRSSRRKNQENRQFSSIKKQTSLFVNLRCMKFSENLPELYLGGGITVESKPEEEWQETLHKAETMLKVL